MSNLLDEKFQCLAITLGDVVGEMISCLVEAQIAAKLQEIEQLRAVLATGGCTTQSTDNP
jgi:predicted nuclease of predicted toxin-antitoxin system